MTYVQEGHAHQAWRVIAEEREISVMTGYVMKRLTSVLDSLRRMEQYVMMACTAQTMTHAQEGYAVDWLMTAREQVISAMTGYVMMLLTSA